MMTSGYILDPKNYYIVSNGLHGTLICPGPTTANATGEWTGAWKTNNSPSSFNGTNSFYVRNQVYRLNNYGNVDINGWDGEGIDVNEENGTLFAPTIGAGYKDPFSNTFTGILMGIDKSQLKYPDGSINTSTGTITA